MQNQPLVSIITPNYNTEEYLAETIESVISQSYNNWELIIVDDHSTDSSVEIIKSFSDKHENIIYLQTKSNSGGPATPRNIGLDYANGEYVAFLDSDDTWFPKKLEFHINFMQREHSNFSSTFRNTFSHSSESKSEIKESKYLKVYDYSELLKKNLVDTSAVIIKKETIGDIRFDTSKELIAIEDYDFWLQILKNKNEHILISKVATVNYRITGENISKAKFSMAKKFINVISRYEKSPFKILYCFLNYSVLSVIYLVKER